MKGNNIRVIEGRQFSKRVHPLYIPFRINATACALSALS